MHTLSNVCINTANCLLSQLTHVSSPQTLVKGVALIDHLLLTRQAVRGELLGADGNVINNVHSTITTLTESWCQREDVISSLRTLSEHLDHCSSLMGSTVLVY